jgi:uracil-DNA glycosylase
MPDSVARFVADLARERPPGGLVNQYAVEVPGLDRPGGAATRCDNLRAYLEPRIGVRLALIGEAPSAHGARFSGIAFTDERSLPADQRTSADRLKRDGFAEHSATVLRGAIEAAGLDPASVVLWNAVPFHPARADDPLRNRRPTADELAIGRRWLDRFLVLMQPEVVVGLGQSSKRVLPAGTLVLRHPANGGKPRLQAGLMEIATEIGRDR